MAASEYLFLPTSFREHKRDLAEVRADLAEPVFE